MIETIDLQSRGLDPQAPLKQAETELTAANSRLADMADDSVPSLRGRRSNLERESSQLLRVRLPELEQRAQQLRGVLAAVRDRSDRLAARLNAKATELPTLSELTPSFGVSSKQVAGFSARPPEMQGVPSCHETRHVFASLAWA